MLMLKRMVFVIEDLSLMKLCKLLIYPNSGKTKTWTERRQTLLKILACYHFAIAKKVKEISPLIVKA